MGTAEAHFGIRQRARQAEHEQYFYLRTLQECFYPTIRWLDAGCGHNLIQPWLRDSVSIERRFLSEAAVVVGSDVDWKSLVTDSAIRRIACDLETMAFPDNYFDLITCNMVVEHLERPSNVFAEFFRVLRHGGRVLILTPNVYHWANAVSRVTPYWFHKAVNKAVFGTNPDDVFPTLYRCNSESALRSALGMTGFSSIVIHSLPGRPRLADFGPLFYIEYAFYQVSLRFSKLREILCVVAEKAITSGLNTDQDKPSAGSNTNQPARSHHAVDGRTG